MSIPADDIFLIDFSIRRAYNVNNKLEVMLWLERKHKDVRQRSITPSIQTKFALTRPEDSRSAYSRPHRRKASPHPSTCGARSWRRWSARRLAQRVKARNSSGPLSFPNINLCKMLFCISRFVNLMLQYYIYYILSFSLYYITYNLYL